MRSRRRDPQKNIIPDTKYPENLINESKTKGDIETTFIVKKTSSFSHYFHIYYIFNGILVLLYPLHRLAGLRSKELQKIDWIGYSREKTIIATFFLLTILRYKKYCISWLIFKIPVNRGPHNFVEIEDEDHFDQYVLGWKNGKPPKKKFSESKITNYREVRSVLVEFWAPFAETCTYTRSLWAEYSRKYKTKMLHFAEVNVTKHPDIAKDYSINTSGVSRQLPTLIMFENGQEVARFPAINEEGKVGKVLKYDQRLLSKYFDLENRYFETMSI